MTDLEQTRERLRDLTDELTHAVLGLEPQYSRPVPYIMREMVALGHSEEGRRLSWYPPYPYLVEWRAFLGPGVSEGEQERQRLLAAGWASPLPGDAERERAHAEQHAKNVAESEERQRQRREQERVEVVKPLTRRAGLVMGQ